MRKTYICIFWVIPLNWIMGARKAMDVCCSFSFVFCLLRISFSPFCPSAKMTKWCVPEPKKSSTSLRLRRFTSCDHPDNPSEDYHDRIHRSSPGLLREPRVELWSRNPPPSQTHPAFLTTPPPQTWSSQVLQFLSSFYFITQKLGSFPFRLWERGWMIWLIEAHGLSTSSWSQRPSLWNLQNKDWGDEKLLVRRLILLQQIKNLVGVILTVFFCY